MPVRFESGPSVGVLMWPLLTERGRDMPLSGQKKEALPHGMGAVLPAVAKYLRESAPVVAGHDEA